LEAARAIRPALPALLPAPGDQAAVVDRNVAELLARARSGAYVEDELLAVFAADHRLQDWVSFFLAHGLPREVSVDVTRGGVGEMMAGHGEPLPARRYVCPAGDFVYYERAVTAAVPRCPEHGALIEAER
jgi:hypothetical protein